MSFYFVRQIFAQITLLAGYLVSLWLFYPWIWNYRKLSQMENTTKIPNTVHKFNLFIY